jgi:protein-arginine kinase activator protein McsA
LKSGESDKTNIIEDEITKRELSGKFDDIPVQRLEKMLEESVKSEDFNKAAKIQDELDRRDKK